MADEVNWGRVRPWDGAKGCPPVAVGKPCAAFEWEWVGLDYPALGVEWMWESDTTAYRIPAEFDHLDDNGDPVDPLAGYTPDQLRAAADAKDGLASQLPQWQELWRRAHNAWNLNTSRNGEDNKAAARILRDGAAKLLGVTL